MLQGNKRPSRLGRLGQVSGCAGQSPADLAGHLRKFWVAPGKGLPRSSLPAPTFGVQPPVSPLLLLGASGAAWEVQGAGGLPPRHTTGLPSQPAHSPADVLGKGLAARAASTLAWAPKSSASPSRSGEGVPGLLTRDDLHLPGGLLADSLSHTLSDSSSSLSSRSVPSLFLFSNLPLCPSPSFPLHCYCPGRRREGWGAERVCNKSHPGGMRKHKRFQKRSLTCAAPTGKLQREEASGTCWRLWAKAAVTSSRKNRYT